MARDGRLALLPRRSKLPKLGRRPKPPDHRDLRFARYRRRALAAPPSSWDWTRKVLAFPMLLNDRLGDCGEAGWLHGLQVWLDNAGRVFAPTDTQALDLYERVGGYRPGDPSTDNGTVLRDLLKYVRANAVDGGQRILAFVAVDPHDPVQVKQAIATFGFLYVGVSLTRDNYETQGVRWHVTPGEGGLPDPELGHCVIYTGYSSRELKQVTWGQKGSITWACHKRICDEAWAVVSPDWLAANGLSPRGLDIAALEADLADL